MRNVRLTHMLYGLPDWRLTLSRPSGSDGVNVELTSDEIAEVVRQYHILTDPS